MNILKKELSLLLFATYLLIPLSVLASEYDFPETKVILIDKITRKPLEREVLARPAYKFRCLNHWPSIITFGETCHYTDRNVKVPWVKTNKGAFISKAKNLNKEHTFGYSPYLRLQVQGTCKGQEWSPSSCSIEIPLAILKSSKGSIIIEVEGPEPESMSKSALEEAFKILFSVNNSCHLGCAQKTSMHAIDPRNTSDINKMPFCAKETLLVFNSKDDPKKGPILAEKLQECLIISNIKCMRTCGGFSEVYDGNEKHFILDPGSHEVKPIESKAIPL